MPWSFFFRPVRIWTGLRLGRVLLALAFACGPTLAFSAGVNGSTGHLWNAPVYGNHIANDALSACAAGLAAYRAATGNDLGTASVIYGPVGGDPNHFVCQKDSGSGLMDVYQLTGPTSCAPGYTYQSDGSCKSNQPSCTDPSIFNAYKGAGYTTSSTQSSAPDYICIQGCQYDPGGVTVTYPNPKSLTGYTSGGRAGSAAGKSCDMGSWPQITIDVVSETTDPKNEAPSPESCAAQGKFYGTLNGVRICAPSVPGGSTTSTTNSSSATNDAPASSPAASSSTNSTSTTTCNDSSCTTTVTVTNNSNSRVNNGASGAAASTCQSGQGASAVAGTCTTTSTTSRNDYCQKNPSAVQCKDDSASGGADCSAPPACSGDAISCAILAQQWDTRCELQKHDDSTDFGAKLANGQDPMAGKLPGPNNPTQVDMSSKFSNVDDMGFAAQCLPDLNIPLALPGGATTLHISTSPLCDIGKLLGYLNMLSTLMLCAYMLKGSF